MDKTPKILNAFNRYLVLTLVAIISAAINPSKVVAQGYLNPVDSVILEFRNADTRYVERAIQRISDLAGRHYGSSLKGRLDSDIRLIQRLLSDEKILPSQALLSQSAGIALGEILAKEQQLKWVRFQDKEGTSRALLIKETDDIIFPATIISRRYQVGLEIDVQQLYDKMVDFISHSRQIAAEPY